MTALILPGLMLTMVVATIWAVRRIRDDRTPSEREAQSNQPPRAAGRPRQRRRLGGR